VDVTFPHQVGQLLFHGDAGLDAGLVQVVAGAEAPLDQTLVRRLAVVRQYLQFQIHKNKLSKDSNSFYLDLTHSYPTLS